MTENTYDVIVLGGGAGGVPAAVRAAQLGARVAIVENNLMGGLCMNRGCVPFGHMMVASNILGSLSLGKDMGLSFSGVSKDYAALLKRQDDLIAFMRQGVTGTLNKNKVEIIKGKGRLSGKGKLVVNGKAMSYGNIILATGAQWMTPDFPGADLKEVINSDELLNSNKLPKRALLFGSTPWLIEIAQFLDRFGSRVTLATRDKAILANENKPIRSRLTKSLKEQGINILTKTKISAIKKKKDGLHCVLKVKDKDETIVVDRVISLQRRASVAGLGLDTVGLDEKSDFIEVNERMETRVAGIYAIGDLAADETRHYSHLSSTGGIVAAENAMGMESFFDHRTIARVVFTQPQIACVGLTSKEAKDAGYDVATGAAPLSMNPFGMIISENEGIVEVVAEKKYGEVLGIHFIGQGACEMAGQAVLAIQMEATLEEVAKATFPHPTLSESLAEAARECLGRPIYLP
ncbi:MAG: NAD(P)/FAD-dependent oxidoreductase [Deltaproteobacteria bacterium]|nr:NAD(P)/FAD-dependent oxidoreductase [Deltaproteobacteria bacterium]